MKIWRLERVVNCHVPPMALKNGVFPTNNGLGLYLIPRHFANSKR